MGYPVVMIHGMWCTANDWKRVRELMAPRGYDCHVPTLPAHEPGPDQGLQVGALSLRDYNDCLDEFVRAQNFTQPPIIVGHSMGGLLAQQLAARTEALALVLLTPAAPRGINSLSWSNLVAFARALLRWGFWRRAHKPTLERARRSVFNGLPADKQAQLYQGLVHESGRAATELGLWWADPKKASAVDPARVRCPVYLVSCGQDKLTPAGMVRKVAALYPQSSLRLYPNRSHWVLDDDETDEMVHAICGWLRPFEQRAARGQQAPA
jgi:pimeloyl-ACP methyl ester carboxylesterase